MAFGLPPWSTGSDRVCKVHLPKADAKEKVKRFQGLGVYVNKVSCSGYRASSPSTAGPALPCARVRPGVAAPSVRIGCASRGGGA